VITERAVAPIVGDLVETVTQLPAADLYVAHYVAALPAAARAAKRHGGLFAFDAEDYHLGDLPDSAGNEFEKSLIRAIERRYLPYASYVTAASPGIADAYAREYGINRPTVILNTFPKAQAPIVPTSSGVTRPGPSVYWFSQTIGPNRGLECAVRAIAMAKSAPHLYLRGILAMGYGRTLAALAQEVGAGDRVHVLDPASSTEMERLASKHDLGLVSESGETQSRRIALTNKLFTYLQAGIPAVLSDIPAHRTFAGESNGAVFLYRTEDSESLAGVLNELLGDRERLASARMRAFQLGQDRFNWDLEQELFLGCVRRSLQITLHDRAQ
jgi:glycosyltransferase involved in cell wall biosynthesis